MPAAAGAGALSIRPDGKGGVRLAKSPEEAPGGEGHDRLRARTKQTGPRARLVSRGLSRRLRHARELYLSLLVDRDTSRVLIMASTEGGMEIEEVAENHPEKILRVAVDPAAGISAFHARKLAFGLGLEGKQVASFTKFVTSLYAAFVELDCAIVEINPLVVTGAARSWRSTPRCPSTTTRCSATRTSRRCATTARWTRRARRGQERPELRRARRRDRLHGERRGPGDGHDGHHQALRQQPGELPRCRRHGERGAGDGGVPDHHLDANVKAILVNIFGGIAKCDMIATGIVEASKNLKLSVPLVVRLEGTNVELGKKILAESGLAIIPADNLADAAQKVVAAVKKAA
jgi:succinyl-CoA synthetase beta subunit